MRRLIWAIPELIYTLLYHHCYTCSVNFIFLKCKLNSAKKYLVKVGPHKLATTERGLQCFSDSLINPLQILIALQQTRKHGVTRRTIPNKQSKETLHYSSTNTEQLQRQIMNPTSTIAISTKTTFDVCMAKQDQDCFL